MDDTKEKEHAYSGERTKITGADSLRSTTAAEESPGTQGTAASKQTEQAHGTGLPEGARAGEVLPAISTNRGAGALAEFAEFLKRTRRVWLIVAVAIFGLMAVVTVVERLSERAKIAREKRQEQAMLEVVPVKLITRCGPAVEDVTKEVYPLLVRTMSYEGRENEKIVFAFSRTSEPDSDWVFLSMKDESGTRSYDTTEAKIAALSCLDSRK
ncbi:MAG TPA: hypothetical protein VFQ18_04050 [Candidatus Acidoferrum sp.]|nr:hypothetical protein [Candidatus Acidoferrum sp.]